MSILVILLMLSGCASLKIPKNIENDLDVHALSSKNSRIAAEILRIDIDQLVALIIDIHPEPFAVIDKQSFLRTANMIKQSIRYPLSRSEFYMRVAPLVALLMDIHSRLGFPEYFSTHTDNVAKDDRTNRYYQDRLFPLAVLYETTGLYVAADLSPTPQVPTGASITAINNVPIEFLLQIMRRLTPQETDAGHRRKIQIDFPRLLTVMGYTKPNYKISYQWQGGETTVDIKGIEPPKLQAGEENQSEDLRDSLIIEQKSLISFYGFSQLTPKTALLWFNDFNEEPQVFKSYLNAQFKQFRKRGLTNLIIDVRYNDGGRSQNIKALLSHLTTVPVFWANKGQINISKPLKKLHSKKTRQRRKNKSLWGLRWLPLEWTDALRYQISWADLGDKIDIDFNPIEPANQFLPKKIIVLTNGFCYSACSSFVAVINQNKLAKTMGEKTGSFAGVQYAYPIEIKLPHSQLNLTLPTTKFIFNSENSDRKLIMKKKDSLVSPVQPINRSLQEIIERQDSVLNEALRQIEKEAPT